MPAVPKTTRVWLARGELGANAFTEGQQDIQYGDHDLLVGIKAVSVNPLDNKLRKLATEPKQLGFDAAGIVVATGKSVTAYKSGDEVFYAGTVKRPGSNAEYQAVDERLVAPKPKKLSWAEAAAVPLTILTAYESLFDILLIPKSKSTKGTILIFGGAGGAGSMMIQLARYYTSLTVVATASRQESLDWCRKMGAHHVVDHKDLPTHVKSLAPNGINYFVSVKTTQQTVDNIVKAAAHRARVVQIDDSKGLEYGAFKSKAMTIGFEMMMTTSMLEPESTSQRDILTEVSELLDDGAIQTTLTQTLSPLSAKKLYEGAEQLESGTTIGKIAITKN